MALQSEVHAKEAQIHDLREVLVKQALFTEVAPTSNSVPRSHTRSLLFEALVKTSGSDREVLVSRRHPSLHNQTLILALTEGASSSTTDRISSDVTFIRDGAAQGSTHPETLTLMSDPVYEA